MNYSLLSKRYNVRKMNTNDVPLILSLCLNNEQYYRFYPPLPTEESILCDLSALPPNKAIDDKYYLGYFDDDKLIAVMDLIIGFPNDETAFVGFFMLDAPIQKKCVGTSIISELCSSLKDMGVKYIRLAWAKANSQASHFWLKNDFKIIKETEQDNIALVIGQKDL